MNNNAADTDWFVVMTGMTGSIEWTVTCEQQSNFYLLASQDCATVEIVEQMLVDSCYPQTLTIYSFPGEPVWHWVGPSTYSPPTGFAGYNYNYQMEFSGLYTWYVATEESTFEFIKSMYR